MGLYRTDFEIDDDFGGRQFFPRPVYLTPCWRGSARNWVSARRVKN